MAIWEETWENGLILQLLLEAIVLVGTVGVSQDLRSNYLYIPSH